MDNNVDEVFLGLHMGTEEHGDAKCSGFKNIMTTDMANVAPPTIAISES